MRFRSQVKGTLRAQESKWLLNHIKGQVGWRQDMTFDFKAGKAEDFEKRKGLGTVDMKLMRMRMRMRMS